MKRLLVVLASLILGGCAATSPNQTGGPAGGAADKV
jgi:hypothetical protein